MFPNFLTLPVDEVAKQLLGCMLVREIDKRKLELRIVEVEAYDQNDEASHAYGGKSKRNATMFGEAGHLYVYFVYGMHYCCNIVTGKPGIGSGVLIRAAEPISGVETMKQRRGNRDENLTNGPAKLCQALGIDLALNGHDLRLPPLKLFTGRLRPDEKFASSSRIGITKAKDRQRRYYIEDNNFLSQ